MNREGLDANGLCKLCSRKKLEKVLVRDAEGNAQLIDDTPPTHFRLQETEATAPSSGFQVPITFPGTPPQNLTSVEKEYYLQMWEEYKGHYRDPTVYSILHHIILLQIELNLVSGFLHSARMDAIGNRDLEDRRTRLIDNLKKLRDQLPQKEMDELSDDDKSMALILERYKEQKAMRYVGGVSRMLSPEACALAPALHFKIDVASLLKSMNYQVVDIEQAMEKFVKTQEMPNTPEKMLEFLGFFLKEEYAMDSSVDPIQVDDQDFDLDIAVEEVNDLEELNDSNP